MASAGFRGLLAASLVLATTLTPLPSEAQFGFRKLPRLGPRVLVGPSLRVFPGRGVFGIHKFGRVLGIAAAVVVGGVILSRLSKNERVEVGRRSKVVVYKDPDQRVSDTYESGNKQVTITAEPSQKIADIKDDPALQQTAEQLKPEGKNEKPAEGAVKISELAPDTQCRKVTTELQVKPAKNKEPKPEDKSSNVSIHCKTPDGEWKPASA